MIEKIFTGILSIVGGIFLLIMSFYRAKTTINHIRRPLLKSSIPDDWFLLWIVVLGMFAGIGFIYWGIKFIYG